MPRAFFQALGCTLLLAAWSACREEGSGVPGAAKTPAYSEAARLSAILREKPDSMEARLMLSELLEEAGDGRSALATMEQGVSIDATRPAAWNRLAYLRLTTGDTAGALMALDRSFEIEETQPSLLLEAGFIHASRNDSMALAFAEKALTMPDRDNLHSRAMYLKGVYLGNTGQTDRAIAVYDSIILSDYTFVDAYIEKGILQLEGGQAEKALSTFDKALLVANTNADAYLWKGSCLEALGRREEAADFYAKALGLDEGLKAAREGLERMRRAATR